MRDARTNPYRAGECRVCAAPIFDPSVPGRKAGGEGQWIHLELPATPHPARPR